uniref:Uncharacterized protein n=1 Tax=Arundo donax TaxID=35708 RepID=A0A0A9GL27_ARUDO
MAPHFLCPPTAPRYNQSRCCLATGPFLFQLRCSAQEPGTSSLCELMSSMAGAASQRPLSCWRRSTKYKPPDPGCVGATPLLLRGAATPLPHC